MLPPLVAVHSTCSQLQRPSTPLQQPVGSSRVQLLASRGTSAESGGLQQPQLLLLGQKRALQPRQHFAQSMVLLLVVDLRAPRLHSEVKPRMQAGQLHLPAPVCPAVDTDPGQYPRLPPPSPALGPLLRLPPATPTQVEGQKLGDTRQYYEGQMVWHSLRATPSGLPW